MTARAELLRRRSVSELEEPLHGDRQRPRVRLWIVFSAAVVVAFFGLISSRISLDRSAFVLEYLEQQIESEGERRGDLRVEIARLQAPDRISGLAEEMGLVYPTELIALVVPEGERRDSSIEYEWARLRSIQTAHP